MTADIVRMNANRAVYTVAEVAELLSLSRTTTYAMVRSGEIPARKIGDRWIIPKARLHTWLNELPEGADEELSRELTRLEDSPTGKEQPR